MKALKYVVIGFAALLTLVVAAAAYLAATFDPNAYKPQIIALVKDTTQRTLTLDGDIKLSFWPDLGVRLGRMSLSEPDSDKTFAAMESGRVSLELLPLLAHKFVVDQLTIKGLRANIVRAKSGRTNLESPGGKAPEQRPAAQQPVVFDIAHIVLDDAAIDYRDETTGKHYALSGLTLKTGRLAPGVPTQVEIKATVRSSKPRLDITLDGKAKLKFDLDRQAYQLNDLALDIEGEAAGVTDLALKAAGNVSADLENDAFTTENLTVNGTGLRGKDKLALKLDAPKLALTADKASGEKIALSLTLTGPDGATALAASVPGIEGTAKRFQSAAMVLDLDRTQGGRTMKAHLASPLTGNLDAKQFSLPQLKTTVTVTGPKLPGQRITGELAGSANVDVAKERVQADLAGKIADSRVKAHVGIAGFTPVGFTFDVDVDQLDLDRYTASAQAAKRGTPEASGSKPDEPIDLTALRDLKGSGTLHVGALKVSNVKASDVKLGIKASGGDVELNPVSANLYRGRLSGTVTVNAAPATPAFGVKETLTGVDVGPLLHDLAKTDTLEGKGNVSVSVTTRGSTVTAMKKALDGTAAVKMTDGAVKGIDAAGAIRRAQAVLSTLKGEQVQQTDTRQRTDFSELAATFDIRDGIARNNDLVIKSPLLRIGGSGLVNIGKNTIDYTVNASVVATAQGQGGKGLSDLRGVTIPVHVTGPIDAPSYRLDFGALVTDTARRKIEDAIKKKIGEELGGGSKGTGTNTDKARQTIEDSLRKLFGK